MRFARKLAFAVGLFHPRDWVRVRDAHTSFEWALQKRMDVIDPIGEERADIRAAHVGAKIIATLVGIARPNESIEGEQIDEWRRDLRMYLKADQPPEEVCLDDEEVNRIAGYE